ncbi:MULTISPECIES: hypothetical protein [Streptomyces]|uniref:hypothetical protein n=1 Tax=Streptomyces lycopersici TaxID=2974589 RepID=UPI0021CE2972|nr:hypothetical protein [Streptomyces sp. NEAU-383]
MAAIVAIEYGETAMRGRGWIVKGGLVIVTVLGLSGCKGAREPGSAALPERPEPCASRTSDRPTSAPASTSPPVTTRLAYRAEEMDDGSVHMTVGDVDAAPKNPDSKRVVDFRHPDSPARCEEERIVRVRGWWCTTTVKPIEVEGEIVVGGARPRARIGGDGFATRCHGRPERMRQIYRLERDSWSGWRDYSDPRHTKWTGGQRQEGAPVSDLCPRGRTGTYNYRLAIRIEVDGTPVGESWAAGPAIRTDCGTGAS